MHCEQVCELLSAFLDHEVTPDERGLIDLHLAECPSCRQWLDTLRRQDAALRRAFAAERSSANAFADGLKARLARDESARPRCSVLVVDDEPHILNVLSHLL